MKPDKQIKATIVTSCTVSTGRGGLSVQKSLGTNRWWSKCIPGDWETASWGNSVPCEQEPFQRDRKHYSLDWGIGKSRRHKACLGNWKKYAEGFWEQSWWGQLVRVDSGGVGKPQIAWDLCKGGDCVVGGGDAGRLWGGTAQGVVKELRGESDLQELQVFLYESRYEKWGRGWW